MLDLIIFLQIIEVTLNSANKKKNSRGSLQIAQTK